MGAGIDGGADLGEMQGHGMGVGIGHDQPSALALLRADGTEDVGPLGALVVRGRGPGAAPRPSARDLVLLADPGLVLPPDLQLDAPIEPGADLAQRVAEVFLNASTANSFWA